MKKLLLLAVFLVSIAYANAQNTFPASGNVGIGITNPNSPLQVIGTISSINFANTTGNNSPIIYGSIGQAYSTWGVSINHVVESDGNNTYGMGLFTTNSYLTGRTEKVRIMGNGNVGIGVTTPNSKLQVSGSISTVNFDNVTGQSMPIIYGSIGQAYSTWGISINHVVESDGNNTYGMGLFTTNSYLTGRTEKVRISGNGNVGIGTTAPDQKLTVNGTIHSTQVKVDLNVSGPDYVFKKNYNLPELSEVKTYIDKNHHLSEIPSAVQMAKNGVDLGEMNIKLLKKVEELTLYLIEMKKENSALNKRVARLEKSK